MHLLDELLQACSTQQEASGADPGHAGQITSLVWLGKKLSLQLVCCPHNWDPDK